MLLKILTLLEYQFLLFSGHKSFWHIYHIFSPFFPSETWYEGLNTDGGMYAASINEIREKRHHNQPLNGILWWSVPSMGMV